MKNYIVLIIPLCCIICSTSCKKLSNNGPAQVFTWKIDNGAQQSADSISFLRLFGVNTLYASKGTTYIFISTSSTSPGIYTKISATAGFGLTINGMQYADMSGMINITSNSDYRLSGNFTALLFVPNVDTVDLSGSFSNVKYY